MTKQSIKWTVSVQVDGGPAVNQPQAMDVDAYDSIGVTLAAGTHQTVDIPGNANLVQLVLVTSDLVGPTITFAPAAGAAHTLDSTLLLTGAGAVGLLGNPPTSLTFTSTDAKDAHIRILVGRNES